MTLFRFSIVSSALAITLLSVPEAQAYRASDLSTVTDRPASATRDVGAHARLRSRIRRSLGATNRTQSVNTRNRIPRRLVQQRAFRRDSRGEIGTLRTRRTAEQRRRPAETDTVGTRRLRRAYQFLQGNTNPSRQQYRNLRRSRVELKRRWMTDDTN